MLFFDSQREPTGEPTAQARASAMPVTTCRRRRRPGCAARPRPGGCRRGVARRRRRPLRAGQDVRTASRGDQPPAWPPAGPGEPVRDGQVRPRRRGLGAALGGRPRAGTGPRRQDGPSGYRTSCPPNSFSSTRCPGCQNASRPPPAAAARPTSPLISRPWPARGWTARSTARRYRFAAVVHQAFWPGSRRRLGLSWPTRPVWFSLPVWPCSAYPHRRGCDAQPASRVGRLGSCQKLPVNVISA